MRNKLRKNKLRDMVKYSPSHTHFCKYMSFIIFLCFVRKKKFITIQKKVFYQINQKARVNLTTSSTYLLTKMH